MKNLYLLLVVLVTSSLIAQENLVEITLEDKLDEPRGFCLDTRGFQHRANIQDGLQTHTCYSYQGQLAIDQAFDENLFDYGIFKLVGFEVCMSLENKVVGTNLALEDCEEVPEQSFNFGNDGTIIPLLMPNHCITAGPGPSIVGGMGMSPARHLIRSLSVEECRQDLYYRQQWKTRKKYDE
ncbi:MAG: hypothetical protein CBC38_00655 [Gammaproteobacteria bacterium TMED78]|nr:MAG: hypothetical protein CBC38_00655 [Gammaproteobacteria bacterium TMED78]|tara:strand:+ start:75830 stop:76372 length:543 start_codon:yes stop_codon:yes gene_type:complete